MKAFAKPAAVVLLSAMLIGCGSAAPTPAAKPAAPAKTPAQATAAATPDKSAADKLEQRPAKRERPVAEKAKVAQLFQVPQFNLAPNASVQEGPSAGPQIKLLGFSNMAGVLKALIQVKGEVLAVEQGDVIDGAEVVALDAEGISFQYSGQRRPMRLFEKSEKSSPVVLARAGNTAGPLGTSVKPLTAKLPAEEVRAGGNSE